MPLFEIIPLEQAYRPPSSVSKGDIWARTRDCVVYACDKGRFNTLTETQMEVLALSFFPVIPSSTRQIGELFNPPKDSRRISEIKVTALRKLGLGDSSTRRRSEELEPSIESLSSDNGYSPRTIRSTKLAATVTV